MKISLKWLREFIDFKATAEELAEILIGLGLEAKVESKEILDIEITPNRGDCLSVLGIARELSAKLNLQLKLHKPKIATSFFKEKLAVSFSDEVKKLIPFYSYRIIKDVKVTSSPKEIVEKLESYGFRPINNIVDITNLVMIELGMPLHAFDYEKLGGSLYFRLAKKGEKIITLDGNERVLPEKAVVAEDKNNKLTDLAGIMGGFASEVDSQTKIIVLQSAIFDAVNIRKTSKYLHFQTDASYRYERGVDCQGTMLALNRATDLIQKTAKGEADKIITFEHSHFRQKKIKLFPRLVNQLLGTDFSKEKIEKSLEQLFFEVKDKKQYLEVSIPSFRDNDVCFWQDLAEEVARLEGYEKIKPQELDKARTLSNLCFRYREFVKDKLIQSGFSETLSYSFISSSDVKLHKLSNLVKIKNPFSLEHQFFRPTLLVNVLKQVAKSPYFPEIKLFEIGQVADRKSQRENLLIIVSGKDAHKQINKIKPEIGKVLNKELKIKSVSQDILLKLKIKTPVFYSECELNCQKGNYNFLDVDMPQIKTPSNFAPAQIDLAFIVEKDLLAQKVKEEILSFPFVILAELFDEFESFRFGKNRKNIAFHIWLEGREKTLTNREIQAFSKQIISRIEKKFRAQLRKF